MWNHREGDNSKYDEYLEEFVPNYDVQSIFPLITKVDEVIKHLPNWKVSDLGDVYNFFIKRCTSLHPDIYRILRKICLKEDERSTRFYKGTTYLIPKGEPKKGSDFRPIACMSNLYKLATKCVARIMQMEVSRRGLLAENQMGTVSQVQGAKEQALLNLAVNKEHKTH
ncbi:hypothetical protein PAEPH01_2080 [Pancytospora epiphaga]|nr:hypothetical protein PAEPH01_2080 [Pancytospora epiphaga]